MVDSRNLSTGQGHVVLEACRLRNQAASLDELCQELEQLTGKVEASFLLNRLDYMVKGGRCSTVAALGANLLNLKPCIEVRDGKMQVVKITSKTGWMVARSFAGTGCLSPIPRWNRTVWQRCERLWTGTATSGRSSKPPPGAPSPATAAREP